MDPKPPVSEDKLIELLEQEYNYTVRKTDFTGYPHLRAFRSVVIPGKKPRLLTNQKLTEHQRTFVLAKELGFLRGWGKDAARAMDTMRLLSQLLEAPDPGRLEMARPFPLRPTPDRAVAISTRNRDVQPLWGLKRPPSRTETKGTGGTP